MLTLAVVASVLFYVLFGGLTVHLLNYAERLFSWVVECYAHDTRHNPPMIESPETWFYASLLWPGTLFAALMFFGIAVWIVVYRCLKALFRFVRATPRAVGKFLKGDDSWLREWFPEEKKNEKD